MAATKDTIAVLIGGGIQSLVLMNELSKDYKSVVPIYVVSGFIWEPVERYWLRRSHRALKRQSNAIGDLIDISLPIGTIYRRGHWSTEGGEVPSRYAADSSIELPGRNLLLISVASVFCKTHGVKELAMGTLATNIFPDASADFLSNFEELVKIGFKSKLKIITPLAKLKKAQVVKKSQDIDLSSTFSCINPKGRKHCGECYKCGERARAFSDSGVKDPTTYENA